MARSFINSKHKWTYIRLAFKFNTTPWHVFDLAHGKVETHAKDERIMHALKEEKIIHRHHSSKK